MPRLFLALAAVLVVPFLVSTAHADPAGKTTLEETLAPSGSGFLVLQSGQGREVRGAPRRLRQGEGQADLQAALARQLRAAHGPADRRRDEPRARGLRRPGGRRAEVLVAPAGGARPAGLRLRGAQRQRQPAQPRQAGQRQARADRRSRSPPATSPTTSSSTRRAGSRPCSTAAPSTRSRASRSRPSAATSPPRRLAQINADVAARNYTGVADYDDYRDAPADRFAGFYDPDEAAPTSGPYPRFPRYPGLLEAAQRPFQAAGLDMPWYISRGNHDGLIQGNAPASEDLFRAIAAAA